jgi:hypothetical protein
VTTYKQNAAAALALTLVRHPGTAAQRAVQVVRADRADQRAAAVARAAAQYPGQPLGWLDQTTRTLITL